MNWAGTHPATYFGKIPARGDFVRGHGQHQLTATLDRWVSGAMESLSDDPRWKETYDRASGVDFAFVGTRSRISVVGHLVPSRDASGRRFPFLTSATLERDDSLPFRCAPAALARPLGVLRGVAQETCTTSDPTAILERLTTLDCTADFNAALETDPLGHFVRDHSLATLAAAIGPDFGAAPLRRVILAIGLLLRPMLGNPGLSIDKEISLPLPTEDRAAYFTAGWWLYLISAFLRKGARELQLLVYRSPQGMRLCVGFNGASSRPLAHVLASETYTDTLIDLTDPQWIEEQPDLTRDYGIAKLASYLDQPTLSVEAATSTFREVFLGE